MKKGLVITIICLFAAWLASLAVLLLFLADLTTVPLLVAAIVVQIGVAAISGGILLVTNTRRPWSERDPYAATTADLLREPVLLPDGRPYGRRKVDDGNVVERLSAILEEEAAKHPPGARVPPWAIEIANEHAPQEDTE